MAAKKGAELQHIFKKAKLTVRERAKASGAPLFYFRKGKRIREDADGSKHVLVIDSEGKLSEFDLK